MMDVFYNRQGIGDVLILPIKEGNRYEWKKETNDDITKITSIEGKCLDIISFKLPHILI